jgi:phosphonate transport system ATP-binding protein
VDGGHLDAPRADAPAARQSDTRLAVRGLSMRYPSGTQALQGLDLDVRAGELLVVLGGNGCGKTTLLR